MNVMLKKGVINIIGMKVQNRKKKKKRSERKYNVLQKKGKGEM